MYGSTQRALGQMKSLTDCVMDVRNEDETFEDLRRELERFMEIDKRNWSRELRDLGNSIIELVMDELD